MILKKEFPSTGLWEFLSQLQQREREREDKSALAKSQYFGLTRAYLEIVKIKESIPVITLESLLESRQIASSILINPKTKQFEYTPVEFKSGEVIVAKAKNFSPHPEVLEKLAKYGYKLKTERIVNEGKEQEVVKIDFGSKDQVLANLNNFISELNAMIQSHKDPYEIITFAVQELLIIHPFKDGNGRIARVLGQRLAEELFKETIFFPKEFFKEMNFSRQELIDALKKAHLASSSYQKVTNEKRDAFLLESGITVENILMWSPWGAVSYYKMDGLKLKKLGDQDFDPIKYHSMNISLDNLNLSINEPLYFGAKRPNIRELFVSVKKYFESGRQIKGNNMHRDIYKHQRTKQAQVDAEGKIDNQSEFSSFIQTSRDYSIANSFANGEYGFVLVVDPRGAQVLDINSVSKEAYAHESEVVFDRKLDPRRIKGAILLVKGNAFQTVENPNYDPKFIEESIKGK